MFFIIPIGFLKVFERIPWVNLSIIAICVLLQFGQSVAPGEWIGRLTLFSSGTVLPETLFEPDPDLEAFLADDDLDLGEWRDYGWTREPWALVTNIFLHGGWMHLIGNMVFLFVFGCGLNSDLGHLRYLAFYVAAGLFASILQLMTMEPGIGLLGASGAISAVTGMVVALYPRNEVRVFYLIFLLFFFRAGTFEVSALWIIAVWFGFDLWGALAAGDGGVAYIAHVAGSVFGFGLGVLMLKRGWVESDGHDIVTWYFKGQTRQLSHRARRERSFVRSRTKVGAPADAKARKPAPSNWATIPLSADAQASGQSRPPPDPKLVNAPVSQRIERFFAQNPRASVVAPIDRASVLNWYKDYRKLTTRKPLSLRALAGVARTAAAEKDVHSALDAYSRLVIQLKTKPDKRAAIALEAAKFLLRSGLPQQADQYLAIARAGPLTPDQARLLETLETHDG